MKHFSKALIYWESEEIVLWIGKYGWTRKELAQLGCYSFRAARSISRVCRRLGISHPSQLKKFPIERLLDFKGVGERSLRVISHIIKVYAGDHALNAWLQGR